MNQKMKKTCLFFLILSFLCLVACTNNNVAVTGITTAESTEGTVPTEIVTEPLEELVPEQEPEIYNVKMTVTGDIMMHEWQVTGAYRKETNSYDFTEVFEMVKPMLESADITLGNLETTFGGAELGWKWYPTFNTPDSLADSIKHAGFDVLTTANNHSMDTKNAGLERTIDILDSLELIHIGTYKSQEQRDTTCIVEVNNIRFAFLSYTYGTNWIPVPEDKSFSVNFLDTNLMVADIKKAREQDVDFVVVMPHFGNEYELVQNKSQMNIADTLFEAGADVILGSHAHVLQPMEVKTVTDENGNERQCFVIYSLGNFVSSQTTEPRDTSILLNLEFEKQEGQRAIIKQVGIIPTWVQFRYFTAEARYFVRVLPLYETLKDIEEGKEVKLMSNEGIVRMKAALKDTLSRLLGEEYANEMKEEYIFYQKSKR